MPDRPARARSVADTAKAARGTTPPPAHLDFSIVGIGASAGGFEAFVQLLAGLPAAPNLAIIFVQHLAPNHPSSLASLLSAHTPLPVIEATDAALVAPNRVYVAPPNTQMEYVDGHLHLSRRPRDRTQYNPIDFFFRSLARSLGGRAIGVVLSGTASDGALGIREIKAMEGIAFAQDPATAKYDGMPRAAIATQVVDIVAAPSDIAAALTQISKHPYLLPPRPADPRSAVQGEQLDRIFRLLLPTCGVNFSNYRTATIVRRLFRRMALLRVVDVDAYIAHLEQTPEEIVNLHNDLLIHVTQFLREPESFDVIARDVCRIFPSPRTHLRACGSRGARPGKKSIRWPWSQSKLSATGLKRRGFRFSGPMSATARSTSPGMACIRKRSPKTFRRSGFSVFLCRPMAAIAS